VLYIPERAVNLFVSRVNSIVPEGAEGDVQLPAIVELIYNQIADGFHIRGFRRVLGLGYYGNETRRQRENWRRKRYNDHIHAKRRNVTTLSYVKGAGNVPGGGRGKIEVPRMHLLIEELFKGGLRKTIVERAAKRYAEANNVRYDTQRMDFYLTYAVMVLDHMGLLYRDGKLMQLKPYRILEDTPEILRDKQWENMLPDYMSHKEWREKLDAKNP
jgi:hypothetical protein